MELFYILLGVIWVLGIGYFWKLSQSQKLSVPTWIVGITTVLMGVFCLGWAVESLIEGEIQAAGMGVLIFGGMTILLLLGFKRLSRKDA